MTSHRPVIEADRTEGRQCLHCYHGRSESDHRVTEADDGWADACERLGVDRDAARRATDDFLFPDFPLRNTDRHRNDLGLIRDVEAFAIGPAPIFDSGASPRNGMEPDAMNNGDCRTKPFRIDD